MSSQIKGLYGARRKLTEYADRLEAETLPHDWNKGEPGDSALIVVEKLRAIVRRRRRASIWSVGFMEGKPYYSHIGSYIFRDLLDRIGSNGYHLLGSLRKLALWSLERAEADLALLGDAAGEPDRQEIAALEDIISELGGSDA